MKKKSVTYVIPCLNEERTLPLVLEKLVRLKKELKRYEVEILVSDNGSEDASVSIAKKFGARVVHCKERGYGAALNFGITNAKGEIVIFADADNTYDFLESPSLLAEMEKGAEFVIGSRLSGNIQKGAMPFLHRYLGTPVINWIINLLYSKKGNRVLDSNSGFRCFLKSRYLEWEIESTGMEFASEMLVKALRSGVKLSHVPVSLHPDVEGRVPHLRTWRDGMRHLLQILIHSQQLFYYSGWTLFALGWSVTILGYSTGIVTVGPFHIFGIHSMTVSLLVATLGQTIWAIGLFLAARKTPELTLYSKLNHLSEDLLFWYSARMILFVILLFCFILFRWWRNSFQVLDLEKEILMISFLSVQILNLIGQTITAHLLKRT
ncbi:glycosyltransferase family 2 protein [Leptospira gomenensis]|uniref:Glycosyltransferase family 2 protein n=1 Tax=Leptospira gomenensis TaxID=2484974 RepID=A0A5F1YCM2_9LEPT|nr:glycosyltransferase family 2 protein [Leptospira gomenensis]TGK35501.1 glycosyltransferase family 2 protein [Leptospira gomenensis]TGK40607.1 glycosyltransferase family 2 protein [Leptospira gomenensis]TGK46285.1 glycosyltransferase family 2 protein [Leptospira gomenensis]TGK66420.1 glycosyltransferase family 2 protein [Leptospira gomenensis]